MTTKGKALEGDEKLARYLGGEMSEKEELAYEADISVSGENVIRIEKLKKQWSAIRKYNEDRVPDTAKAWTKVHDRLTVENLVPVRPVNSHTFYFSRMTRIAATVLALAAISVIIYFTMVRKTAPEMATITTSGTETGAFVNTLADGTTIYLAGKSSFSFPVSIAVGDRGVGLQGEAYFEVTHDPGRPFVIETEEALIEVLGTAFNVKAREGEGFELAVDRGKVRVTLKSGREESRLVSAGEMIRMGKGGMIQSSFMAGSGGEWRRERMHFKDASLENIISVLNRNFNTTFVLADERTGKRKITVTFQNEPVETMTVLICMTLNLKSEIKDGSIILSEDKGGAGKE